MVEGGKNISFVVLHYRKLDITRKCVDALLELEGISCCGIVIVDNASGDGSGLKLQRIYNKNKNIVVLLNKRNLGFSKGNNIGYAYAKKMGAEYIICMNNDIIITQNSFIRLLQTCRTDAQIIGPDIVTADGTHQNPLRNERLSSKQLLYFIVYNFVELLIYSNRFTGELFLWMIHVLKRKKKCSQTDIQGSSASCVLHGACVIFMPGWTRVEDFAFVPRLYMYGEEDFLAEFAYKKGYRMAYHPKLQVQHLEGVATKEQYGAELDRRRFKNKNLLRSFVCIYQFRGGIRNKI